MRFYAVIRWSAPWAPRIQVSRMFDTETMSGIGWVVESTHGTYREAMQAARELRRAD